MVRGNGRISVYVQVIVQLASKWKLKTIEEVFRKITPKYLFIAPLITVSIAPD